MMPYGRQSISEDDIQAVVDVLRGDWLTTGPSVQKFEEQISKVTGGHRAVTATSGTAALHMAYAAAGVGPNDEVITTPMTFVATASSASMLGAKITFADIELGTGLIDPKAVDSLASDATKVIAAVDYAGQPADYDQLQAIADRTGALTLADAAHSIGGTYKGRPIGDLADLSTFSFFPTKNMTTGEGGAVIAKDPVIAQRAHEFHFIGLVRDPSRFRLADEGPWHQEVHSFGLNYRLTDIGSALGIIQLAKLDRFKQRRTEITNTYNAALSQLDGVIVPEQHENVDPMWHLYPLRVTEGRRREVFEKLRNEGIGVQVNYIPVYWHPAYADLGYKRGMCPNAEQYYAEELSLPIYPDLTDAQVFEVIEKLERALK